ncbi:heparan-alpha-glucosaminide N-acetyltransferase domain-containing protein [Sorangium sp. So ce375]|uniref:heparan-alpha-glucosaminide N-acetyltransferase domain-containing protein n=1 Tax=Sorangium sp. So ce375 TaxID=3133306 RepID=UPI003F5BDF93
MRYLSIDILRTVAVVVMVQVHFVENLSGLSHPTPNGFGAPIFAFLLGVSYFMWLNAPRVRGANDAEISKLTIRRGLFLFGTGILFNIFVWLPEDTFDWDVLTFLGVALMFLNIARKLPRSSLLVMCSVVFVISPMLRVISDYPAYWVNNYFDFDLTLSDVLLGFLVNGYFPVFPWIVYPIVGFMIASRVASDLAPAAGTLNRLTGIGVCLIGVCVATRLLRSHCPSIVQDIWLQGWTMFPSSVEYMLGTLGLAITAFTLLHRWVDLSPRFSKDGRFARVFLTFGPRALSVYVLHHLAHIWPLWIYGLVTGPEPTVHWQKALPVTVAWPLAFVFLTGCYFLLRWMERTGKPGLETLMRWTCD